MEHETDYVRVPVALYYEMEACFLERLKNPPVPVRRAMIAAHGERKIAVIKVIRNHTQMNLSEAKRVVESLPHKFTEPMLTTRHANRLGEFIRELREQGATVEEVRA